MIVQAFPSGPFDTNAYLVVCPKSRQAAIIDPAPESANSIIEVIEREGYTPTKILLTHSHWDHIGDVALLKERYQIPVFVHSLDAPNLEAPGSDQLPFWMPIKGVKPDGFLNEGDRVQIGEATFEVVHTPGHTPGGICLYSPEEEILLSGDTLFKGTIGNLSLPTAQPEKMWPSLDKLSKLPPETRVYPGHGPATTIGKEVNWLARAQQLFGN